MSIMKKGNATVRLLGTTAILYVHYEDGTRRMHELQDVNEWRHVMPWVNHKLSEHKMLDNKWKNGRGGTIVRSVVVDGAQQAIRDAESEQKLRREKNLDKSQRRNCSVESSERR